MHAVLEKKETFWMKDRRANAEKRDRIAGFFKHHRNRLRETSKFDNELYMGYWSDENRRMRWTRALADFLGKDPRALEKRDFADNGLGGLLHRCGSIYGAVSEAYPELQLKEWEMLRTPSKFFNKPGNRIMATRWLAGKLKKDPRSLIVDDFRDNGLPGLIFHHNHSTWKAVAEAYPELVKSKDDMFSHSNSPYATKQMRLAILKAVLYKNPENYSSEERAVAEKHRQGKIEEMIADDWRTWRKLSTSLFDPRDFTREFFESKGLLGLFQYYDESAYKLICDLLPGESIKPWELLKTPAGTFDSPETRREATRWLCEIKLKRDPREVTGGDFAGKRLSGLLSHYSFTHYLALSDAYPELNLKPWEMKRVPRDTFSSLENRGDAILWLAEKAGKRAEELVRRDFISGGLGQILRIKVFISEAIAEGLARKEQLRAEKARDF